jgi:hypothetical protein
VLPTAPKARPSRVPTNALRTQPNACFARATNARAEARARRKRFAPTNESFKRRYSHVIKYRRSIKLEIPKQKATFNQKHIIHNFTKLLTISLTNRFVTPFSPPHCRTAERPIIK